MYGNQTHKSRKCSHLVFYADTLYEASSIHCLNTGMGNILYWPNFFYSLNTFQTILFEIIFVLNIIEKFFFENTFTHAFFMLFKEVLPSLTCSLKKSNLDYTVPTFWATT